jgi:hypothetical protein
MIPGLKPRSLPMTIGTRDLDKTFKNSQLIHGHFL